MPAVRDADDTERRMLQQGLAVPEQGLPMERAV